MLLSPTVFWIVAGVLLCLMELVLPTAFAEFTLGISAILVGILSRFLPDLGAQVVLWLILSVIVTLAIRRFLPQQRSSRALDDAVEAKTLTEIPAGETGRVIYEGNSWQARCGNEELTIAPNRLVYVIDRRGTTLIVMPMELLQSSWD